MNYPTLMEFSYGRKQLRSIVFTDLKEVSLEAINELIHESLLLDESKPYESKRKAK